MAAIGTLRNKAGGILIVVLVIAMISFLFMDMGGSGNGGRSQVVTEIAKVNGESISLIEFNERLDLGIDNYKNQTQQSTLTDNERNTIRQNVYNDMVLEAMNKAKYDELGIAVSDEEMAAMLTDGPFQHPTIRSTFVDEAGQFSSAQLTAYLDRLDEDDPGTEPGTKRRSWQNFERYMETERLGNKYSTLLSKGINVPTWMAEASYNGENTPISFEYVYMPFRDIEDNSITVSDNEIAQYITKNAAKYEREASVDLKFATFPIVASEADYAAAQSWTTEKVTEWSGDYSKKDSLFLRLYSDVPFTGAYFRQGELTNIAADSIFDAPVGSILGPYREDDSYTAYKVMDKKMLADSVKVKHIVFSYQNMASREELLATTEVRDSLYDLIISGSASISSLASTYSEDPTSNGKEGDLGWIKKEDKLSPALMNAVFFDMSQGDVMKVSTEAGIHIVEVTVSKPVSMGVKVGTLSREVYPSDETQRDIYSAASSFAGTNRDRAAFEAAGETNTILSAENVAKDAFTITQIPGNSRELIKWAFKSKEGEVSAPYSIGESYVVALLDGKSDEGTASVEDVRFEVEAELIKLKKAATLTEGISGSDLNSIASSNSKTVATANSVTFGNPNISGVGNEPAVVGAALGLAVNSVSKPIIGNTGVFVVKTIAKTDAPASSDLASYKQTLANSLNSSVRTRLEKALKDQADIEDNRFDVF